MTEIAYREEIKEEGKYIILIDDSEVYKVFDTPSDAHEYASARIKHTKNNRIEIYLTTGKPTHKIDGITVRDDIKPFQHHHIGINW